MGVKTHTSVMSFFSFGVLSLFLLQLYILKSAHALTSAEIDLLRRQKPVQREADIYSDAARFTVEIAHPIGGRLQKCGADGTHVVQLALQSNPTNYSFAYNVDQRPDGFVANNLVPNTDYIVRVACRFNEGSPGEWSEPAYFRTKQWTGSGSSGSGQHHHHHHDHQDGGGGGKAGQKSANSGSPKTEYDDARDVEVEENSESSEFEEYPYPELPIPSMLRSNGTDEAPAQKQFYAVLGEWGELICNSTLTNHPLAFEWIHIVPSSGENVTVKERFGVKIMQEESTSVLMMIVKTEDMFGQYICESRETGSSSGDTGSGQKEEQNLFLLKGRRPPRIHLIPELILMTTASFKVEPIDEFSRSDPDTQMEVSETELNEKFGVPLPHAGYVVWIKPDCHLLGEWIPANVTELENGFRLNNLKSNEGYYIKAAQRNTGAVGDFGEYWKIRTSSAVMLKSSDAMQIHADIFVGKLTLVIATALLSVSTSVASVAGSWTLFLKSESDPVAIRKHEHENTFS